MTWPVNPLRGKTTDRRAVCGKSACTVRRGEGPKPIGPSYPYLPCRGNGFPAIRRRLTHGRVRYRKGIEAEPGVDDPCNSVFFLQTRCLIECESRTSGPA